MVQVLEFLNERTVSIDNGGKPLFLKPPLRPSDEMRVHGTHSEIELYFAASRTQNCQLRMSSKLRRGCSLLQGILLGLVWFLPQR